MNLPTIKIGIPHSVHQPLKVFEGLGCEIPAEIDLVRRGVSRTLAQSLIQEFVRVRRGRCVVSGIEVEVML